MSDPIDDLLDDLLDDESRALREESLTRTLAAVRRGRMTRRVQQVVFTGLIAAAFLVLRPSRDANVANDVRESPLSSLVVETRPLRNEQIVRTRPASVSIVPTSTKNLAVVHTPPGRNFYDEISDQQLLALLGGREGAIFRSPEFGTRLVVRDESIWTAFR